MAASPRPRARRSPSWSCRWAMRAALAWVQPNYFGSLQMRASPSRPSRSPPPASFPTILRRAFTRLRSGRGGPVLVEIPVDVWAEEIEAVDYEPVRHLRSGPDPEAVREAAAMLLDAKRPVIYAGQGVHWAEAWPELSAAGRAPRHPGLHQPRGQERLPRDPSAGAGLRRPRHPGDRPSLSSRSRTSSSASAAASGRPISASPCRAEKRSSTRRSIRWTSTRTSPARGACWATPSFSSRRCWGRSSGRTTARPAIPAPVAREIAEVHERWLGRWLPKLTVGRSAARPLPGALGPPAHGRHGGNHHHPRRRQPARPALAVLAVDNAALLHRLGQVDPARLRAGPRDGRQAREAREALHQRLGRRRDRLHRHGHRDGGPRAYPYPFHPAQQLLDGDRAQGDAGIDRPATAPPTSRATMRPLPGRWAPTASGSPSRRRSCRPSAAASKPTQQGQPALLEFITSKEESISSFRRRHRLRRDERRAGPGTSRAPCKLTKHGRDHLGSRIANASPGTRPSIPIDGRPCAEHRRSRAGAIRAISASRRRGDPALYVAQHRERKARRRTRLSSSPRRPIRAARCGV